MEEATLAGGERCDLKLIKQLKASGRYDTIIHKYDCIRYVNSSLEYYEQSTAPDSFLITYKKFYSNGVLKERRQFLPEVYISQSFSTGVSSYYDNSGILTDAIYSNYQIFPFPRMADIDYCIRLL